MSQQGLRQKSVRAVTGSAETYEGDWIRLFDLAGVSAGHFDERLLKWINLTLSAAYTNLPQAQQAYANAQGATNWGAIGTFSAATFVTTSTDATAGVATNFWAGDQGENTGLFSLRLAADDTAIRVAVSTASDMSNAIYSSPVASAGKIARCSVAGLTAGTLYYYALVKGTVLYTALKGNFRTLPSGAGTGTPTSFTFALASCWDENFSATLNAAIAARNPLFFYAMGDSPYLDRPSGTMPTTRAARDTAMDTRIADDGQNLYLKQALYYSWSDHDAMGNNATGVTVGATLRDLALQWYRDWTPMTLASATATDHVGWEKNIGRVRLIGLDCRSYASNPADTDNSSKTRLGTTQKTWFKSRLADAAANGKIVIVGSEVPWIAASDNDTWFGYSTERAELADYMKSLALQDRVMIVAGDAHMVAWDAGVNGDYATGGGMDIPVLQVAPMGSANSVKGGPYSGGTFSANTLQYGVITVTDSGGATITVKFDAYTSADSLLTTTTLTLTPGPTTPSIVQTKYLLWAGGPTPTAATGSVTLDQATNKGNLLVGVFGSDKALAGSRSPPAGWSLVSGSDFTGAGVNCAVYTKIADGTESVVTYGWTGANAFPILIVFEVRGVDTLDVAAYDDKSNVNTTKAVNMTTATTTVARAMALAFMINDSVIGAGPTRIDSATFAWTNGFSSDGNNIDNPNVNTGWPLMALAHKVLSATGAVTAGAGYTTGLADEAIGGVLVFR